MSVPFPRPIERKGNEKKGDLSPFLGISETLEPLGTSSGWDWWALLLCQLPSPWPVSAAQSHILLKRGQLENC